MTAIAHDEVRTHNHIAPEEPVVAAAPTGFAAGNPAVLGLPVFVAGTVALALALVGYVPGGLVGGALPIILASTGLGLSVATIWAAALGQTAVAGIFGIFAGFWLSYGMLVLGLTHNWFGVTPEAVVRSQALFLVTWLVVVAMLTLATLRLPLAFTLLFLLVDLTLIALIIGTLDASLAWVKFGGYLAFAFAAIGVYLFVGIASEATGGNPMPLGRPVLHS